MTSELYAMETLNLTKVPHDLIEIDFRRMRSANAALSLNGASSPDRPAAGVLEHGLSQARQLWLPAE